GLYTFAVFENVIDTPEATACENGGLLTFRRREWFIDCRIGNHHRRSEGGGATETNSHKDDDVANVGTRDHDVPPFSQRRALSVGLYAFKQTSQILKKRSSYNNAGPSASDHHRRDGRDAHCIAC